MIKSKFRIKILALILFLLADCTFILALIAYAIKKEGLKVPFLALGAVFLVTWCWLFFHELRLQAISIKISGSYVTTKNFMGLGFTKEYVINEFDGYIIKIESSRYSSYPYLYLMKNNRRLIRVSKFYHRNYKELKSELTKHLPLLPPRIKSWI